MNKLPALIGAALLSLACFPAIAAVNIFACVPEWAALAKELGGDKVSVYQASTALQDPHRVEARPSLIARMRSADLAICTGSDLEVGWLPVLLQAAGNRKVQVGAPGLLFASDHVERLEVPTRLDRSEGDIHPQGNPHVQMNPHNIAKIAEVVTGRLAQVDATNAAYYEARGRDFQTRWRQAITNWEKEAAPLRGMKVVGYHKSMTYLFGWLGIVEVGNLEPKPGIPPSAAHLADLVGRLQSDPVDGVTRAMYNDPKAAQWLSERTKTALVELPYTVGGTPEAKDLFTLFDDTIARLKKVKK